MRKLNFLNNRSESISTKTTLTSQKLLVGILTLVLISGMTSPAFALVIDDFKSGDMDFVVNSGNTPISDSDDGLPLGETIGGTRNATGTWSVGGSDILAMLLPPHTMGWSAGSQTSGNLTVTWNGTGGNTGLGGVDLTLGGAGTQILVNMTDADMGSDVSMWLWDTTGKACSLEEVAAFAGQNDIYFPYSDFTDVGNDLCEDKDIDFSSINTVMLKIVGLPSGDYEIDLVGIPQERIGGTVGSMSTATLLVAGAQANMGLWSLALVGAVGTGVAIIYKKKSNQSEQ